MSTVVLVAISSLFGSFIVWRMDKHDNEQVEKVSGWKMELVRAVAEELQQPVEEVKLRQAQITSLYAANQPFILAVMGKVHPLMAPFASYVPGQSRLLRFTTYQF